MPALASAASRLRPAVSKNASTALSSNEGEFARSSTTCAPASTSARPSPVMVLTPEFGDAATTSCPFLRSRATVLEPISPVPPITTIFMFDPSGFAMAPGPSPRLPCDDEMARAEVTWPRNFFGIRQFC